MWCWHNWDRWITYRQGWYTWQYRECFKCGKRVERMVP